MHDSTQHLRPLIRAYATKIESLISVYPQHFHTIEDAKTFIRTQCEAHNFEYAFSTTMAAWEKRHVVDKARFIVALCAYEDGEFHLRVPLARPDQLREAVEANIHRLTPLLPPWPPIFTNLSAARDHVRHVASEIGFKYIHYPGVETWKFEMWVNFNTARRAYEEGMFETVEEVGNGFVHGRFLKSGGGEDRQVGMGDDRAREVSLRGGQMGMGTGLFSVSTAPYAATMNEQRKGTSTGPQLIVDEMGRESPTAASDHEESTSASMTSGAAASEPASPCPSIDTSPVVDLLDLGADKNKATDKLAASPCKANNKEDPFENLLDQVRRHFTLKAAFE